MPEFPSFIDKPGARDKVLRASMLLVAAVTVTLWAVVHFHGDVRYAAVPQVIALSWPGRLLRRMVPDGDGAMPWSNARQRPSTTARCDPDPTWSFRH